MGTALVLPAGRPTAAKKVGSRVSSRLMERACNLLLGQLGWWSMVCKERRLWMYSSELLAHSCRVCGLLSCSGSVPILFTHMRVLVMTSAL